MGAASRMRQRRALVPRSELPSHLDTWPPQRAPSMMRPHVRRVDVGRRAQAKIFSAINVGYVDMLRPARFAMATRLECTAAARREGEGADRV